MEHLHLNRGAQMHVDAYLEYLKWVQMSLFVSV